MKKLFTMIMIVMMAITMVFSANAEDDPWKSYLDAEEDLNEYIRQEHIEEYYNNTVDDWGVYGCIGLLDTAKTDKEIGGTGSWDDTEIENWFEDWYEMKLMEKFPEFGQVYSTISRVCEFKGRTIWHLTVGAENDLIDSEPGTQQVVDMLVIFY